MLNGELTHKSTSDKEQVFVGTSGNYEITVQYPMNCDDILVKVFVDDEYVGAFEIMDITENNNLKDATEDFLWNTNALHDC